MGCRYILHVDMDAFFAAIEQRDTPEYQGKSVIIGADPGGRGVVSTCSYEARKYGVRSAMPIGEAYRRCPQGIFLRPHMDKYQKASREIQQIFSQFSPLVEVVSVDEAFIDVTGTENLFGPAVEVAKSIKSRIKNELQLTASVGIGPNKMIAKIASDLRKPDGLVEVKEENVLSFLAPLPVGKIWGLGPKAVTKLNKLGVKNISELQKIDMQILINMLGSYGEKLYNLARGIDLSPVVVEHESKSLGREKTFHVDTKDVAFLEKTMLSLAQEVGWRLRKQSLKGNTVVLKLRDNHFMTITRQKKLDKPTDQDLVIYTTARELFHANWNKQDIRLLGVTVTDFNAQEISQLELFSSNASNEKEEKITSALDVIRQKYGYHAVTRAKAIGKNKT